MNSNDSQTLTSNTINDRAPVKGSRRVLRGWVSALLTTYDKYYLGFGQGG